MGGGAPSTVVWYAYLLDINYVVKPEYSQPPGFCSASGNGLSFRMALNHTFGQP
jgi:hypothetical protein